MPCYQHTVAFRKLVPSTFVLVGIFFLALVRVEAAEPASTDPAGQPGRNEIRLDFSGTQASSVGVQPQVMDVVATGAGVNPEQAKQNAFSAAIEQVVGVLVDAETLVENDKIVRDQVLTFSRGYLNEFEEIARYEKDGLHFVRIRAKVSVTQLGEKLKTQNIATREIPGSLLYGNLIIGQDLEKDAREMFRKATIDYGPDKLVTVTMLDKPPEVDDTGTKVNLKVAYRLAANLDAWKKLNANLKPVLDKTSFKHTSYTYTSTPYSQLGRGIYYHGEWESSSPLVRDPGQDRTAVYLFKGSMPDGNATYWDGYFAYPSFKHEIAGLAARHQRYRVCFSLVDSQDRIVASVERSLTNKLVCSWSPSDSWKSSSIGPLLFSENTYRSTRDETVTFTIDAEQLGRVAKCTAKIQLASADQ